MINEIMFNPIHADASEFIELFNRGNEAIDIGGWAFTSGIDYSFPREQASRQGASSSWQKIGNSCWQIIQEWMQRLYSVTSEARSPTAGKQSNWRARLR